MDVFLLLMGIPDQWTRGCSPLSPPEQAEDQRYVHFSGDGGEGTREQVICGQPMHLPRS